MLGNVLVVFACCLISLFAGYNTLWAKATKCEECHIKITPGIIRDFARSVMNAEISCTDCHGIEHNSEKDIEKAQLPTIATCEECHPDQSGQYLSGKHALGLMALEAMPYTHMQPKAFIQGQKGCGGCHTLGLRDQRARQSEDRRYYRYGMDCQSCHTRHAFSKKEASEPEACMTCHMGFDHAQWEMYSGSKHGVTYLINRDIDSQDKDRAPKCQTCHMSGGNHRVFSAWGFLAVHLPEDDKEWMGFRTTILKALGVLDVQGQPTTRLEIVMTGKFARLTREEFQSEREKFTTVCKQCHTPNFVNENMKNADLMVKEADRIFSEAIEIVVGLYKDGIINKKDGAAAYPDLLAFYDVDTKIEEILYEMFMDHRMKTFQGAFHLNFDYSTWYGYAKMKKDLTEIKELAQTMRTEKAKIHPEVKRLLGGN
jgi:hydroxylamine dehydrogenase